MVPEEADWDGKYGFFANLSQNKLRCRKEIFGCVDQLQSSEIVENI
jgi:hypothetical protein